MASTSFAHLSKQVLVEELKEKSIDEREVLAVVEEEGHTWMTLIYEYLTEEILPEEKMKARSIRRKASRYAITNGILYKISFLRPWLRCVGPLQADYILTEIHEGSCNMHAGSKEQIMMEKYYNARVRNTSFKPRDLVYRSNKASHAEDEGKLGPKSEGPYEVTEALGKGAYKLWDRSGNILPRTWNICNLKKCYAHEIIPLNIPPRTFLAIRMHNLIVINSNGRDGACRGKGGG
nr:reverse transcriptase domain-containing protein [Tanacetum cinerariifolium]